MLLSVFSIMEVTQVSHLDNKSLTSNALDYLCKTLFYTNKGMNRYKVRSNTIN